MAVIRVEKTKNYTVMSNYHLKEKNMSLKAKGLLSLMLSLPEGWDYSIDGLVSICKEDKTAIKSTLSELKQFGYLEVIKKMPNETNTGRIEYEYIIYEMPKKQEGKKQGIENLSLEFLEVENKQEYNTNNKYINNTKESIKEKLETSSNTRAHKYGEYKHVLLTDKQMAKLVADYGKEETNKAITYLDEYIQMKGYKCKDHNLAIRKWVFDALKEHGAKKQQVTSSYQGRNYSESDLNSMFMGLGDLKI